MTEMTEREKRLKKLNFRADHRGIRELDILVGGFAKQYLEKLSDLELDQFEALMHVPDQQFYAILRRERDIPEQLDCPLLRQMIDYAIQQKTDLR